MPVIVKPRTLGLLFKCERRPVGASLVVSALAMFDLADPNRYRLEGEQGLWVMAAKELPPGSVLDICMPKPQAELLIGGHAAAPNSQPTQRVMLAWRFGPIDKRLLVTGDRYWQMSSNGWRPTEPQPFLQMPLGPARCFGGEGFAANPSGVGYQAARHGMAGEIIALPNIEIPEQALQLIETTPKPATFGPLPLDAKERLQYAGTYDNKWLTTIAPALATDADPRLFLIAPQDQRLPGYLNGDEPYALQNFSADHAVIQNRLPAFRVRTFIGWADATREPTELPMRIDTLWLFAGARRGIMVYRGVISVAEKDGKDVSDIMLAYERSDDTPRPLEHYLTVRKLRLDQKTAARYAFAEHQLAPALPQSEIDRRAALRRERAEQRAQQHLESMRWGIEREMARSGLPPMLRPKIELPPAELPAIPQPLPEELESGEIDLAEILDAIEAAEAKMEQKIEKMASDLEPARAAFEKIAGGKAGPDDIDALLASLNNPEGAASIDASFEQVPPLPELPPEADHTKNEELGDKLAIAKDWRTEIIKAAQPDVDETEQFNLARARFLALPEGRLLENVRNALSDDAFAVPEFPPILMPPEAAAAKPQPRPSLKVDDLVALSSTPETPPEALEKLRASLTTAEQELVKALPALAADGRPPLEALAGPDQPAVADTPEAVIASVEGKVKDAIAGTRTAIDQAEEQLGQGMADLRRMSTEPTKPEAPLAPAVARSLGEVVEQTFRQGNSLAGRDLAGADLSGRDLSQADLSGAFLERCNLKGTKLAGANLTNAVLAGACLLNADLSQTQLASANLSKADCRGTRFAGAVLKETLLLGARLECASFDRAQLQDIFFLQVPLMRASFRAAQFFQVIFLKSSLDQSIWDGASLNRCNFMDLSLAGARFPQARLLQTSFMKVSAAELELTSSQLDQVAFVGEIDLRAARFDRSTTSSLSFNDANIANSDFTQARLDGAFFGKSVLSSGGFRMTSMKRAILSGNDMRGADFFASNLLEAQLNQADLSGASFRHANLFGADVMDAVLAAADLSDANVNRTILMVPANVS